MMVFLFPMFSFNSLFFIFLPSRFKLSITLHQVFTLVSTLQLARSCSFSSLFLFFSRSLTCSVLYLYGFYCCIVLLLSLFVFRNSLSMECQEKHFCRILLFYFSSGKRATDVFHDMCETYGVNTISQKLCEISFSQFFI